jgi:1-deoxy-D-xylulose-5-phosphate synthase
MDTYPLLATIDDPQQLRTLSNAQLIQLAGELRRFMIASVGRTGGHLSSGLGAIELTIALHTIFDTPDDRLIWDVGHQSYPHKILTGRREQMSTLRQLDGLAGFPKREESRYDAFGTGHSSTSISAALGMAIAARQQGSNRRVVAIIGDGAMTAGMAFEALNHAGDLAANLLVVLNDNEMSISPNVGALSNYLAKILSGPLYSTMREGSKRVLQNVPTMWEMARRTEEHLKGMVAPGTLFEELGFNYIGPINGHDLPLLLKTLGNLKSLHGPQLLHVITRKGMGYPPAEENPCTFHGVPAFDTATGKMAKGKGGSPTYTQIFSDWLCAMAAEDPQLIGITPAMREGSGLVAFSEAFPDRYFDVGIAEQHAVTFAAGLACEGFHPVVAIYSTFLQRAYDQVIHDVALQNLPVLFAIDRAGIVGPDGPTHIGCFDIAFLRTIPNLILMTPSDEQECRQLLTTGYHYPGPAAVRYPRGKGPGSAVNPQLTPLPLGRGIIRRHGKGIALLAFGPLTHTALALATEIDATVADMRFVKPLDHDLLHLLATSHDHLVTLEDHVVMGGAGSAVAEWLLQNRITTPIHCLGIPDRFIEQGEREELLAVCGLDVAGIRRQIAHLIPQPR